jgi:hypothetical protein
MSAYTRLLRIRLVLVSNTGPAMLTNIFLHFWHSLWKNSRVKFLTLGTFPMQQLQQLMQHIFRDNTSIGITWLITMGGVDRGY